MKLSTGVMVLCAHEESFTLMTRRATCRRLDRVQLGGRWQEDRFWEHTPRAPAGRFGVRARVDTRVVCLDRRRQCARAGNVWHSAAVRSAGDRLEALLRRLARR